MTDIELAEPLTETPEILDPHEILVNRCIFTTVCLVCLLILAFIVWLLHFGFRQTD